MDEAQVVGLLVRRCVWGDAAAWEEIVQRYHRRIYNVCYRFAGDSENAQDLTQEVFIKMYRTLNTYDSGKGAFMTWVTTITRNLLVDHFRKSRETGSRIRWIQRPPSTKMRSPLASRSRTGGCLRMPRCRAGKRGKWCIWRCRNCLRSCGRR